MKLGAPPVLLCAGQLLTPLLAPWGDLALFATGLYFFLVLVRHGIGLPAFKVLFVMMCIADAGPAAKTILGFGHSCG
jgi:hypothetical protein